MVAENLERQSSQSIGDTHVNSSMLNIALSSLYLSPVSPEECLIVISALNNISY